VGESLWVPRRVVHPNGPKAQDGTIITELPVEMCGRDMTSTVTTDEGQICHFVAVDHCACACIGIHAVLSSVILESRKHL
jgi:hypothetical protein